jgi:lysozyme family protein
MIWDDPRVNAGKVALLQPRTGLIYADGAVNHGHWATNYLQAGVGARVDGWCGPMTLAKVKLANDAPLAAYLLSRRKSLYLAHPDYPHAGHEWRRRLNQLAKDCDLRWYWTDPHSPDGLQEAA